ncbi:MAG TPA: hypothetical protein VL337_08410 [Acidimicrobiales bacterium]|jgi:hypothetical protein|nr:hypothetical protein [Acidimicrobiales bacterium]
MRLVLGSRSYDLDTRALVIGVDDAPGADLVEGAPGGFATAADDAGFDAALSTGACLIHLTAPTAAQLRRCAEAGIAVVDEQLFLDVAGEPCPLPALAAGVVGGARIIRTADVRAARRVVDVIAAILEAGK